MPTIHLVGIFIALSLFCIVLDGTISGGKYDGKPIEDLLIRLMFFFQGLSGIPSIIRKEFNIGVFYLQGASAVVFGIVAFIIGISLASMPIWSLLLK